MRPPPTRMGNGGRYFRTNASMGRESTSSDTPAISKSLRSNSRYSSAMWGNSSRQGSHHDAQKFTSVTLPRNPAGSSTSTRRRVAAESSEPSAYSRPPAGGPSARATFTSAFLSRRSAPLAGRNSGSGSLPPGNSPRFAVQESWPAGVYLRISSRTSGA